MSQSIKLNDNLYWDSSSVYNIGIKNLGTVRGNTVANLSIPNNARGLFVTVSASSYDGYWTIYGVSVNSAGDVAIHNFINGSVITMASNSVNTISISNTGASSAYILYIGTQSSLTSI